MEFDIGLAATEAGLPTRPAAADPSQLMVDFTSQGDVPALFSAAVSGGVGLTPSGTIPVYDVSDPARMSALLADRATR